MASLDIDMTAKTMQLSIDGVAKGDLIDISYLSEVCIYAGSSDFLTDGPANFGATAFAYPTPSFGPM